MNSAKARGAGTIRRVGWLGGILCFALGVVTCAPDETVNPLDSTAPLANSASSKGWWHWMQTLWISPDSATIAEPGDTLRLTAILTSSWKRGEPPTLVEADWFLLDPEIAAIEGPTNSTPSVLLRGREAGVARVVTIYDGLAAIARVWVEQGDTTGPEPVPVAAAVSGSRQPVLLVGDTMTVRPNLIDEDSVVIPTEPSEWSTDFDPSFLSVSEDFLVTALAPTPPGSSSTVTFTHVGAELSTDVRITILPDADPGEWPDNEPPGMTQVVTVDGSTKFWPGFNQYNGWNDDNRVAIVDDPDSKHGKAIEKRFFIGEGGGWHGVTSTGDFGIFKELYIRIVFRLSSNWQWHHSGGKYFYYGAAGRDRFAGPTQFILGWEGNGMPFWISGGDGRYMPNGVPPTSRDVYHTIELHHVASTSGPNGSLRMWVDGVEVQNFTRKNGEDTTVELVNREWSSTRDVDEKRLSGMQAFLFWGGQGDTKRVNDWIRLSELYISGKN